MLPDGKLEMSELSDYYEVQYFVKLEHKGGDRPNRYKRIFAHLPSAVKYGLVHQAISISEVSQRSRVWSCAVGEPKLLCRFWSARVQNL